eukprot:scaffold1183_cov418-Prasinococcus_capsulatus_cf.AAC.17
MRASARRPEGGRGPLPLLRGWPLRAVPGYGEAIPFPPVQAWTETGLESPSQPLPAQFPGAWVSTPYPIQNLPRISAGSGRSTGDQDSALDEANPH